MTTSNRTDHNNKTKWCRSENSAPLFYPKKIRRGGQKPLMFDKQNPKN